MPKIMEDELKSIIKQLKNNKAEGLDKIRNELMKMFQEVIIPPLAALFNEIIRTGTIPRQWQMAEMILIYKKGEKEDLSNYRPISITSNISKIFMACLKNRAYKKLDENQGQEQAGFRRGFSTCDNIFIVNQIIEKANEYNITMSMMFIDYNKAFDSIKHEYLWDAMEEQGIDRDILRTIKNTYS